MRFCTSCGAQADAQQRFCENCGAPLTEPVPMSVPQPVPDNNVPRMDADSGAVRSGVPTPGFSERCNDPEILRGLQKNQKASGIRRISDSAAADRFCDIRHRQRQNADFAGVFHRRGDICGISRMYAVEQSIRGGKAAL